MKTFKELLVGFCIIALLMVAYVNLPMEWRRYKDIRVGNKLITQVANYQQKNHRLPENQETSILLQLGFHQNKQGWQPNYRKLNAQNFQIIYVDGYDAPYLAWDSANKTWALVQNK